MKLNYFSTTRIVRELHKIQLRKKINRHNSEPIVSGSRKKFSEAFAYLLIRQRARDRRVSDNTIHKHAHADTCGDTVVYAAAGKERASAGKRAGWRVWPRATIDEHWVGSLAARNARGIRRATGTSGRTADGPAASAHTCAHPWPVPVRTLSFSHADRKRTVLP